ncbi:hypothetical protein GQ43DRAFT_244549 [Delitschia confertaspora ATCC 74209]|uniref:Uncharacterized protein n=1 Tax=Delitschia confertaspora ATCC 74209 TaxID=1513339 RepID=A0A9P4JYU8_9PLEO|nr:hypothetical protein GQ43DRAFT_244549 [Delitschia confertaspora ATCC 74209]
MPTTNPTFCNQFTYTPPSPPPHHTQFPPLHQNHQESHQNHHKSHQNYKLHDHLAHHLTRDQNLQVKTLREAGFSIDDIADQLHITWRQAQYAARPGRPVTPESRPGMERMKEGRTEEEQGIMGELGNFFFGEGREDGGLNGEF